MVENPKWLSEDLHSHAERLSQAMDAELRARSTPPARYESVFDDGTFMPMRCSLPPQGLHGHEAFELRFSPNNTRPDPQALARMGAALALIRRESLLIGDEDDAQHISVSLTATPLTTPNMLMQLYDEQRAEFKGSALMHQAQVDVLAQKFNTLPSHRLACESRDGKIHEYTITFTRPMAPEALKQAGVRIANWCNTADADTNEEMQYLRERLGVYGLKDTYQVTVGPPVNGSKDTLVLMVPESFTYSSMALTQLCEQQNKRTV